VLLAYVTLLDRVLEDMAALADPGGSTSCSPELPTKS
jgi:hypothetical protein